MRSQPVIMFELFATSDLIVGTISVPLSIVCYIDGRFKGNCGLIAMRITFFTLLKEAFVKRLLYKFGFSVLLSLC